MNFQKKQWQFNDIITEGELNRMEDGIEEGIVKIESHLEENAKKHITESGENINGYYIRFDDGTQICYKRISGFGAHEGSEDAIQWSFPAAYAHVPNIICSNYHATNDPVIFYVSDYDLAYAIITAHLLGVRPNYASAQVVAIGRWK